MEGIMQIKLREYQNECQDAIFRDINAGVKRLACVLPTGSGKTTIFGSVVAEYLRENVGMRAIVISHLGLLTAQTSKRFKEEWGVESGILQANKFPKRGQNCVITTMQSFRNEDKRLRLSQSGSFWGSVGGSDIGLIIIDEAHYSGCKSYQEIMDAYPNAVVVGFTATPFRENKLMTNMFDKVSYTVSMQDLIDLGYLVPPKLNVAPFNTNDPADMFAKMIAIYKGKHDGQKAVIYLKTIDEAELCRNIFVDSGINCSAVTSRLTGAPRDKLLADFREGGGPDVLTTVDVLTAGFDSPNLCALFIPYKVGSVTTFLQRVGRGLRPFKDKKYCDIYAGGLSPDISEGFWEKMTKTMLNQGRPATDFEDIRDILEYADIKEEQYKWTQEVVNMANEVKAKGMGKLFDMIITQKFPKEMLDVFVNHPPTITKKGARSPMTKGQDWYFENNKLSRDGISKQEASAIIMGHKRANGWKPSKAETVPAGKHEGKYFGEVPPAYWFYLSKNMPKSDAYTSYRSWKASFTK
jgi:superfamily II DNA or RNA helicase